MQTETCLNMLRAAQKEIEGQLNRVLALRNSKIRKSDGSYVTEGDLMVQDIYSEVLRDYCDGNCLMVSEENKCRVDSTAENQLVVVVDPIDGTENFTSGLPEWGTSAACFQGGVHIASMIGCPELDLWLASGSLPKLSFESRIHGLSSSLTKDEIHYAGSGYEYRVLGCCVYNMINVIRGSFASFENPKGANSWDVLGGLNLALEKGLQVSVNEVKYAGEYLSANSKYRFKVRWP